MKGWMVNRLKGCDASDTPVKAWLEQAAVIDGLVATVVAGICDPE